MGLFRKKPPAGKPASEKHRPAPAGRKPNKHNIPCPCGDRSNLPHYCSHVGYIQ